MVQSRQTIRPDVRIGMDDASFCGKKETTGPRREEELLQPAYSPIWHIPRPTLGPPTGARSQSSGGPGPWEHLDASLSRGSTSSQGSTASTQSAASGTLLLTAANLASLAALTPDRKPCEETASIASSTHFTVVNGLGRASKPEHKSWCARNHLTVLVCTMSLLFLLGLLAGVLCMELRARSRYD